jgi:hypothetical protein
VWAGWAPGVSLVVERREKSHHVRAGLSHIFATREADVTVAWTVIPNPPYSPDLAASDFHLFGRDGCTLRSLLCYDDKLKHSVCEELGCFSKEFCATDVQCVT